VEIFFFVDRRRCVVFFENRKFSVGFDEIFPLRVRVGVIVKYLRNIQIVLLE